MISVTVHFKDGTKREFPHVGRSGGSYSKSVKYQGEWVVITDEWGNETAFPAQDVREVKTQNHMSGW